MLLDVGSRLTVTFLLSTHSLRGIHRFRKFIVKMSASATRQLISALRIFSQMNCEHEIRTKSRVISSYTFEFIAFPAFMRYPDSAAISSISLFGLFHALVSVQMHRYAVYPN